MIRMLPQHIDEFYIGYEERMAPGIARRVVCAVAVFAGVAAVAIAVVLMAQQTLPASRFEFGVVRPVAGVLRRDPYPSLEVDGSRVWLVGPGKFGAAALLGKTPDGPVVVEGSAIQRGRHHMLEATRIRVGSAPDSNPLHSAMSATEALPFVQLTGEVVDSKCFLGVMNPGERTVHRDCARRCLSGGIPPMLIVRDAQGREELVLLVSAHGRPIGRELMPVAGVPVTLNGRLGHNGDQYVLYVRPSEMIR